MARGAKEQSHDELKRLEQRLAKGSGSQGFAAYVKANFETFSTIVRAAGRSAGKWEEIAKWAEEENLTGGKPVKAATAKRAYEREKARRETMTKPAKIGRSQAATPSSGAAREERLNAPAKAKPLAADETIAPTPTGRTRQTIDDIRKMMRRNDRKVPKPIY